MKNGGYLIIDFKDVNVSSIPVEIVGVYESLKNINRKALLMSGLKINGVYYADCFAYADVVDTDYYISIITSITDDGITSTKIKVDIDNMVSVETVVIYAVTVDEGQSILTVKAPTPTKKKKEVKPVEEIVEEPKEIPKTIKRYANQRRKA